MNRLNDAYHDESAERLQELFRAAEAKREARSKALRLTAFWVAVIGIATLILVAKLWSIGAIAGIK